MMDAPPRPSSRTAPARDVDELQALVLAVILNGLDALRRTRPSILNVASTRLRELSATGTSAATGIPTTQNIVVERALELLASDTPLPLRLVARQVGCSKAHLASVFRKEVGVTPATWRRQQRLLRAAELIRTGMKIEVAALTVGFRSRSAFNSAFRRCFGCTPADLRQALRVRTTR